MQKVFVNSLPKSGMNLLIKCLLLFGYVERGHLSSGTILDRRFHSIFKRFFWITQKSGYILGVNTPIKVKREPVDKRLASVQENEFISSHVGHSNDLLISVLSMNYFPIMVIRDPRAILASFVPYILKDTRHFLHNAFMAMSHEQRYETVFFGNKKLPQKLFSLRMCCNAVRHWIRHPNIYVVKFENLVGYEGGGSEASRRKVIEEMARQLDVINCDVELVSKKLFGPGRHTFRKGKIDSWKKEIPDYLQNQIQDELGPIFTEWGYNI